MKMSSAEAINAYGANKILFIEGVPDRNTLSRLFGLGGAYNPFEDPTVIVAKLPHGKSDKVHLPAFQKLLRETFRLEAKIACITDQDYELQEDNDTAIEDNLPLLMLSLGRKEVENYFLDPNLIYKAAASSARERGQQTGSAVPTPTVEEIREQIMLALNEPKIRNTVKFQVMHQYRETLSASLDPSSKDIEAERWFNENWNSEDWQIRYCPGKAVLRSLRVWFQNNFSLTLSNSKLITAFDECPQDIVKVGQQLEAYFYSS